MNANGEARWLSELRYLPNYIADSENQLIEGEEEVLITCCPWVGFEEVDYVLGPTAECPAVRCGTFVIKEDSDWGH